MNKKYILASLSINVSIILSIILMLGIITIKLLSPIKTVIIGIIILIIISLTMYSYLCKKKNIYNAGAFISFLFNIILIYNIFSLNNQYSYINNMITQEYKYKTYNIYVQKKTPKYNSIDKLNGKKIGMLTDNNQNIKEYLSNQVIVEYKTYNSMSEIITALDQGEIQSFIIDENTYNNTVDEDGKFKNKIRIISSNKIKEAK